MRKIHPVLGKMRSSSLTWNVKIWSPKGISDSRVFSGSMSMLNFVLESFEQSTPQLLPSMKPTWHPKIVFQPSIFRCYVSFREGKVPSFFQVQIDQYPPLDRCHGGRFRHRKPLFLWRYNFGRHWLLLFASTRGPLASFKTNTCDKRQKLKREPDIKQHQKSPDSLFIQICLCIMSSRFIYLLLFVTHGSHIYLPHSIFPIAPYFTLTYLYIVPSIEVPTYLCTYVSSYVFTYLCVH